jgi:DNA-binding IclR family transcriptional regulator
LLELDARGPVAVRTLLDGTDLCESDLHGLLAEFRAAGLVTEADASGRRGYDTTERAGAALSRLRD